MLKLAGEVLLGAVGLVALYFVGAWALLLGLIVLSVCRDKLLVRTNS